jgi:trimethylamine--corrinoid protein Co-methyltransferase
MISEVLQPMVVDEGSLGFDAMVDVGPGGHFFGTAHTLERFEHAFYEPMVSDWRNFETWQADGSHTATERANGIWKRLLAEAVPPALDQSVVEALDAFWPAASARSAEDPPRILDLRSVVQPRRSRRHRES